MVGWSIGWLIGGSVDLDVSDLLGLDGPLFGVETDDARYSLANLFLFILVFPTRARC